MASLTIFPRFTHGIPFIRGFDESVEADGFDDETCMELTSDMIFSIMASPWNFRITKLERGLHIPC